MAQINRMNWTTMSNLIKKGDIENTIVAYEGLLHTLVAQIFITYILK